MLREQNPPRPNARTWECELRRSMAPRTENAIIVNASFSLAFGRQ
jgi:hypothetical protein